MKNRFPLSQKYIDFINSTEYVRADFLEGTTASGKTTVGAGVKFMRMVSKSPKKMHIIASKTTGTAEKNIIQQENGIVDIYGDRVQYFGNGDRDHKMPHLKFEGKIIYVLGYDDVTKWKLVLGGQYGCVYIDEINTANIDFIREILSRNDYLCATLNPDDQTLPVYDEVINRSRPYKKYAKDVPIEIMQDLERCEPVPQWRYWFFTFYDNKSLSDEDIQKKINSVPQGTKLYKNKIEGRRGKATGVVFINFKREKHVVKDGYVKQKLLSGEWRFKKFTAGLDTAYSANSPDTIAMIFQGITECGKLITLDERVYNNRDLETPIAPSDTVKEFIDFLDKNRDKWGFAKDAFVDSADQATLTEFEKYKRQFGSVYNFVNAYKKTTIIDRINFQLGWIAQGCYFVCEHCKHHLNELENYAWSEKADMPEDRNDHTINANQYAWLPYINLIGQKEV